MIDAQSLRTQLSEAAPQVWPALQSLAVGWVAPVLRRLDGRKSHGLGFPKTFNDPIWGVIELLPWETALLDCPLLQRLRGVRQLGMAHTVYPGASHDRLEHTRGVVEAAERMIRALARNAEHRRNFGFDRDEQVPPPSAMDVTATRLAALLHDIGHGPFSHVTEELFYDRYMGEFDQISSLLLQSFDGSTRVAPAEAIAICLVMSEPLRRVFEHPQFGAPCHPQSAADLAPAVASRILGSRSYLTASYLSGVVSGPLDADKLDYMARDSHHAGLQLGLDITRLISKLEVVTVTPTNAPSPELRSRAQGAAGQRFYELGISLAGLGAYEQLVIGRVILYDRIYYHHKVRAAEAMLRCLIQLAEEEQGETPYALSELFYGYPDDTMLSVISGQLSSHTVRSGGDRAAQLGQALQYRDIYYRAFAFAALAARIVFYENFELVMNIGAERASKTTDTIKKDWLQQAVTGGACSEACAAALRHEQPHLIPLNDYDLKLPDSWRTNDPQVVQRLANEFGEAIPQGLPASEHGPVVEALESLSMFLDMMEKSGRFVGKASLSERELQEALRDHLRSRGVSVQEGTEYGGGETDLILPGTVLIENKVTDKTADPFAKGPHYIWQTRRYLTAINKRVGFVVLAYRPENETVILPLTQRIRVTRSENGGDVVQVRVVIPYGQSVPSRAQAAPPPGPQAPDHPE